MKSKKWLANDLPGHLQGFKFAYTEILSWQTSFEGPEEAGARVLINFLTEKF